MTGSQNVYRFQSKIHTVPQKGGAYIEFPYDIRKEFDRGRVKVHVTFGGIPYDGSIVNMGVKDPAGNTAYIIGVRKAIRKELGKGHGDRVHVVVTARP